MDRADTKFKGRNPVSRAAERQEGVCAILKSNKKADSLQRDTPDSEEIEILEIVGLDDFDDGAPSERSTARDADPDPDEPYTLDLDEPDEEEHEGADPELGERARLLRLQADFENYKKRVEREDEVNRRQAGARLIRGLLPVLDNFERAVAAAPAAAEDRAFHDGVVLIFRQLLDELRKEGLAAIETLGQPFDPNLHDAVATDARSELPANTIVEELQRGYMLHDRVLRPALVRVSVDGPRDDDAPDPREVS